MAMTRSMQLVILMGLDIMTRGSALVECQSWCESDYNAGKNVGRHCAPGDMAFLCGGCSFCPTSSPTPSPAGECQSWCEADFNGGNNKGRHCAPGNMAFLCGGCSFCGTANPTPAPSAPPTTSNPTPEPSPNPPPSTTSNPTRSPTGQCYDWCEPDYRGGNNPGRHCAPGNMAPSCGGCPFCGPTPSPTPGRTVKVMSYNTEYRGYFDGRIRKFGDKISEVDAGIVGVQECQDPEALASASGYTQVPDLRGNYIFYNPSKVSLVSGSRGWMDIPRDNYARRTITWAKFMIGSKENGTEMLFFNTHLPHNHNQASSRNTHARIARSLIRKREELGAVNMPTVALGDMNPFASNGASEGSFESTLINAGWHKSYQARGNPGFVGLDKIFATSHWISSNGADRGTGGSDHPAIAVYVNLVG
mmetsp:Transcript_70535/g.136111  ORF Transcript_70535/g.136111 Transcript_70535/m.136111 type:complete len:418 (+) Transcript_70535:77-1330(+)